MSPNSAGKIPDQAEASPARQEVERKSRAKYLDLFNLAPIGYFTICENSRIVEVNRTGADLLGVTPESLIGKRFELYVNANDRDRCYLHLRETLKDGGKHIAEFRMLRGEGAEFHAQLTSIAVEAADGHIRHIRTAVTDVTQYGEAEENIRVSEAKYRALFENAREAFILTDCQGIITDVNRLVEEYGFKRKEFIGNNLFDFVVEDHKARALADFEILLAGSPVKGEMDVITPKGVFSAEYRDNPIRQGDQIVGVQAILTDITKRKRTELLLRHERDKAQQYLDIVGVILIAIDCEGRVGLINRKGCEILGCAEEEVLGKNWFDSFLPPQVRDPIRVVFRDLMTGQTRLHEYVENAVLTRTGEERIIGWHNAILKNETGQIIGVLSSGKDITDRRRIEEALLRSEQLLRTILAASPVGIGLVQDRVFQWCNKTVENLTGYSADSLTGRPTRILYPSNEEYERVARVISDAITRNGVGETDLSVLRRDGVTLDCHLTVNLVDPLDPSKGNIGILTDITERKRAEETYRSLVDHSLQGLTILQDERIVFVNRAMAEITGYTIDEMLSMPTKAVHNFAHPEDRKIVWQRHRQRLAGKSVPERYELRSIRKDGTVRWLELHASRIDYQGKPAIQCAYIDITDRKLAEERLRESEQKFRELFENAREGIVLIDLDKRITDVNKFVEQYGFRREDLIGRSCLDFVSEPYREKTIEDFELLRRGVPLEGEFEVITPKGPVFTHYIDNPIARDGRVVGVQSILTDITERKRAEAALQASEERYRLLADNASDEIWTADLDLRFTYYSPSIVRASGHKPDEVLGKGPEQFLTPASYEQVMRLLAEEMEMERKGLGDPLRSRVIEVEEIRKNGMTYWAEVKASFLRDANGKAVGIMGVSRDVSERKKIEQQLLEYQDRLRRLAAELTLAEERERRRIAVGVHDQIGQRLALTKLTLQSLAATSRGKNVAKLLNEACKEIETVIEDAHSLTFELSNPVLYEVGFEGAVESWLMQQVQDRHGIECTFTTDQHPLELNEETSVTLFYVVRELLTNVIKHAQAKHVDVHICRTGKTTQITVQDDGIGFQPVKNCRAASKSGGFGLFNVQEKLDYLGGRVTITSESGKGTRVVVMAPLREVRGTRERDCRHEDHDRR